MSKRNILLILFFGSLWGFSEVFLGKALYSSNIHYPGVILSILALGILGIAYALIQKAGAMALIAVVATIFRFINAGPFFCHLLAIFSLGVGFDIAMQLFKEKKLIWLSGALGAWLGYALFAFAITYVFRYHYWTAVGFPKVIRYIGTEGILTALGSAVSVWLGYRIGENTVKFLKTKPKMVYGGIIGLTLSFWVLGAI
jgi:hypothetical protein